VRSHELNGISYRINIVCVINYIISLVVFSTFQPGDIPHISFKKYFIFSCSQNLNSGLYYATQQNKPIPKVDFSIIHFNILFFGP